MAKLTRAELEAQLAALDEEDSTELWVEDEKGRKTKLTGTHAQKWLKNLGLGDDEDEPEPEEEPAPDPAPRAGYFGRKG